jgi:hypothetical protein
MKPSELYSKEYTEGEGIWSDKASLILTYTSSMLWL